MALTRQEERALRDTGRRALEQAARAGAAKAGGSTLQRTFATVTGIGEDGTLNIDIGSSAHPQPMLGIRMLTGCRGVKVGDRVVVDTLAHVSIVVGVLAHDNDPYVKQIDDYESGFESYGSTQTPTLMRWGGVVALSGAVRVTKAFTPRNEEKVMFTVPSGMRPAQNFRGLMQGSGMNRWLLVVYDDGTARCARYGNASAVQVPVDTWLVLNAVWILP